MEAFTFPDQRRGLASASFFSRILETERGKGAWLIDGSAISLEDSRCLHPRVLVEFAFHQELFFDANAEILFDEDLSNSNFLETRYLFIELYKERVFI